MTNILIIDKNFVLKILLFFIIIFLNCNSLFSQIRYRAVESYFVDQTKTKISKYGYSYCTCLPDLFEFFLKIEISKSSNNDIYIQSENSKLILGEDTVQLLVYTSDLKLITDKYLLPKGKSYIYLYAKFEKNKIPINNLCLLTTGNWFHSFEFRNDLNKSTHLYIANTEMTPTKIKNMNFKIILTEKTKTYFFDKYSLSQFAVDYDNYLKGIINNETILNDFKIEEYPLDE